MNPAFKRLIAIGVVALAALVVIELFAYDRLKIDWLSFMKVQPAFQPMHDPLPVPTDSIPIEGAVFVPGLGAPANPVPNDSASIASGAELFQIDCAQCHGQGGKGDGPIAIYIKNRPADLTGLLVKSLSDGAIFSTISNGVKGKMPALNENLTVTERWDVINYVRTLK